jgi:hypothetical protein
MIFTYERIVGEVAENFINCDEYINDSTRRFSPSPLALTIRNYKAEGISLFKKYVQYFYHLEHSLDNYPYIIPTAVNNSPDDWCGYHESIPETNIHKKNLFEHLNEKYLRDLQRGIAFLMLDQSHEGYHTDWLWSWFHSSCSTYNIPASRIIYVTGNLNSEEEYKKWADSHRLLDRLCVIPYAHFEYVIGQTACAYNFFDIIPMRRELTYLPDFIDHVDYKLKNLNDIKTCNILQKRPRNHRVWLFKSLFDNNLLKDNIVSMNYFNKNHVYKLSSTSKDILDKELDELMSLLPMLPPENPDRGEESDFISSDCGQYLTYFNEKTILDSWCTVVSEALYDNSTCFISEKTFKTIACTHPFIIYGNKGSLSRLRDMGYKTFHPLIDESYDNLECQERLDKIVLEIKKLNSMNPEDKLTWFRNTENILEHNRETLYSNTLGKILPAVDNLVNHVTKCNNL